MHHFFVGFKIFLSFDVIISKPETLSWSLAFLYSIVAIMKQLKYFRENFPFNFLNIFGISNRLVDLN